MPSENWLERSSRKPSAAAWWKGPLTSPKSAVLVAGLTRSPSRGACPCTFADGATQLSIAPPLSTLVSLAATKVLRSLKSLDYILASFRFGTFYNTFFQRNNPPEKANWWGPGRRTFWTTPAATPTEVPSDGQLRAADNTLLNPELTLMLEIGHDRIERATSEFMDETPPIELKEARTRYRTLPTTLEAREFEQKLAVICATSTDHVELGDEYHNPV